MYHVQPYYFWVFGTFYNSINIGALTLNIPFYLFGLDSVIIQQFSEKLPLIISAFLVGLGMILILKFLRPKESLGNSPAIIFLLLPVTFFYIDFFDNALIISLLFTVLSLLFLIKSKPIIASAFLGVAAATYLYPIFFLLPFIRIVKKDFGSRISLDSFLIFIVTVSVGQLVPLGIGILTRTPISGTILSALVGQYSSITVTSASQSQYSFYFIFSQIGIESGALVKEIIFVLAMTLPVIPFLTVDTEKIKIDKYIDFLFLESLVYIIFAITAEPQYLLAIAPFSIILYYQYGHRYYITSLNIAFCFGLILNFVNNTPLLYLFSNVNPIWQYNYKIVVSPIVESIISILYTLSLFLLLVFHLYLAKSRNVSENKYKPKRTFKRLKIHLKPKSVLIEKKLSLGFIFAVVITLVLIVPNLNHVPNLMLFTPQASKGEDNAIEIASPNNITLYSVEAPPPWSLSDRYARSHGLYYIKIPSGSVNELMAKVYYYNVTFNSEPIGEYNFSTSHLISINSSLVKELNYITISNDFNTNKSITFYFEMPLKVPAAEIYSNVNYLFLGAFFVSINIFALVALIRTLKKMY